MTATALTASQRDRLYQALRDAGDRGVTDRDLHDLGVTNVSAHVESLLFEGHFIQADLGDRRQGRRWILRWDAWA